MEIPEETLLTFEHHEMDEMCSEPANPTSRVGAVTSLVSPTPSEDSQKAPPEKQSTAKAQKLELSPELRHGYRILMGVMSCSKSIVWSFLDPVDVEKYNLWDYHERVKEPMWLRKMESKFENGEYTTITEFVRDFRHMLENCYRYNGLDHWVSKQAMKLERIFEQKLNLMSRPIREKATHFLTSGGRYGDDKSETIVTGPRKRTASRALYGHDNVENSPIVAFIKQEEELNEIEDKRQKEREKKEEILRMQQEVIDWEVNLLAEPVGSQLRAMWEIPQIGHFLYICQSSLNIGEVVFYELERGFLMPRESSTFAKVFTSLLSTPFQRISLNKKPPMPYTVWETKLREKIRVWYKVLEQKAGDKIQASSQLGIDPLFFDVLGTKFVLDKKSYHELTFYQRVWIMKSMVDIIVENHQAIRDCINSMPRSELHAITLGHDSEGSSYIHFPHFCGADVRIYKQTAIPDPFAKPPKEKVKEEKVKGKRGRKRKTEIPDKKELKIFGKKKKKKMKKTVTPVPPVVRERPSRLRQRIIPVLKSSELLFETSESTYTSSIEDSEDVDCVAAAIQQSKLESNRKRNAESDEEYSSNLSENEFHTDENNIVIDKPTCKRKKKCEGIEDNLDADHDCLDNCQEKEKPCSKVMDDDDVCDDKSEIMELNFAEDKNSPVCQEETMENGCSSDDDALDDNEKENNTNELITDFADVENIKDSENDTNRSEIACNDEDKRTHSDKICVKDEQLPVEKKFQTENEVKKELSVEHKQCQEENISLDTLKKESVHIKKPINVVKQEKVSTDQKTKIELADEMTIKDTLDNDESEEKVNILKRELVNGKECPERTDNEDCSNAQEVTDKTTEINHTKEDEKVEEKEEEMIEVLPEKAWIH
uniref:Uncharacterized protein KIAA2026-like n=1 Tax=Saccoglossus kowalevskii TaxID=10224 RepID=A0ABM0LX38_SACKO|nr:PREDICTED: uncharacterized protein KIAA2026-like [Saccoglossus kowalevskii]